MLKMKFYWYYFESGHSFCSTKLSRNELAIETRKYGKLAKIIDEKSKSRVY